jgi:hypothetical protein
MGYDQKLDDKKRADTTGYLLKKNVLRAVSQGI